MTPKRDRVMEVLDAEGPQFSQELWLAADVSPDTLRLMAKDGLIVDLYGTRRNGRGRVAQWASVGYLKRLLKETGK